jgi:hypothetical protein
MGERERGEPHQHHVGEHVAPALAKQPTLVVLRRVVVCLRDGRRADAGQPQPRPVRAHGHVGVAAATQPKDLW